MSYKNRYLDMVARLRARARRLSLTQRRVIVALAMFALLVVILTVEISPFGSLVASGKPSPRTVIAPSTVQYVDKTRTREQQDAAAAAVSDVYVSDAKVTGEVLATVDDIFKAAEEASTLQLDEPSRVQKAIELLKDKSASGLMADVMALTPSQRAQAREVVVRAVSGAMGEGISGDDLATATQDVKAAVSGQTEDEGTKVVAQAVASKVLRPNLIVDRAETEGRKRAARESIKPVLKTTLEGEIIVNKGEVVTPETFELLKTLGYRSSGLAALNLVYISVFVLLLIAAIGMYLAKFRRVYYDSPGLLVLLGSTLVMYALVANLLTVAARSWSAFWGYLMPSAAVAMIVAVLFDSGTALVAVAMSALITGVVTNGNFSLVTLALLGGIFPSLYAARSSTRHELRRVGLYTAFWVAAVAFGATALTFTRQGLLLNTGIGFINGALCTIIAMGSLPFLETTFRVTTNTWLLELAAPDQELLKELSIKAPGTYSHSVMVANLAEAAAREIGSDPMLARVGSYYHDIGKIKRPEFFVENQAPGEDPHAGLSPNLSLLVITSHVRDGVELMEKAHCPPDLVEIVREHHGTSVVRYFYEEALAGGGPVDIGRFRYHYEKPRRRTAGIVMLADAVEATARTLSDPSANSIQQMVDRIIDEKLADGQLDQCSLTFEDLNRIKSVFGRMLIGTYHPRIDYPGARETEERGRAGKDKGPGKGPGTAETPTETLA